MRGATSTLVLPFLILFGTAACGGGGAYGYDREYVPLDDEEPYLAQAQNASYEDVRRDPSGHGSVTLHWFGIVTNVGPTDSATGRTAVTLTHRTHRERHLCSDERASSCRVTVSERPGGPFTAHLVMHPEDRAGERKLWSGSLVRIYGSSTGDFDDEGGPVLMVDWYRHWPRGTYVTTGAAGAMRR